ncbi:uncharacterized protein LOC128557417 [Mercenaria mercenaria]|uniref:uncharacterized protein LOC128557417 n=1 Tax=Mercenaria mercenaria TaxID=6596 RepID=UPI00234EE9D4|nr:uncharacterized protein LOC128557417 [Mercenaria mercenaria]
MLFHIRRIFTLSCCLSVVCAGRNTQATCKEEKAHVLTCEQTLIELVNAQLKPYDKTFNNVDLDNDTESELLDEKTRDVVCSATNFEYVFCMVDNLTACPDLATDEDIVSTWIASLIAPNLDILNSTCLWYVY